jgi:hypothetical protein
MNISNQIETVLSDHNVYEANISRDSASSFTAQNLFSNAPLDRDKIVEKF